MKTYWFIFHDGDILLSEEKEGKREVPEGEQCPVALNEHDRIQSITPFPDGSAVKAVSLSERKEKMGFEYIGLRESFNLLEFSVYQKAGKCEEIMYWDKQTRFCGGCGSPLSWHTEISKKCPTCGKEIWPLLATAIIVLIHKGDEVLLVRGKNFRKNFFGLVAGFVETGETLEEAVHREVLEETGLTISNIRYFSSQPWPYPCGLMVGFEADYVSGNIKVQEEELLCAEWFTRNNLPTLPDKLSIARRLIDHWLQQG